MKYYYVIYNVDKLGIKGANEFFSVDESHFFYNLKRKKLLILGIIDNNKKYFRLKIRNQK